VTYLRWAFCCVGGQSLSGQAARRVHEVVSRVGDSGDGLRHIVLAIGVAVLGVAAPDDVGDAAEIVGHLLAAVFDRPVMPDVGNVDQDFGNGAAAVRADAARPDLLRQFAHGCSPSWVGLVFNQLRRSGGLTAAASL
jgi:hypothetical protein